MASKALLEQLNHQKNIVDGVLNTYLQTHPCLCTWPQFAYWVSKERLKGSYDIIQNFLVEAALSMPLFKQVPPIIPEFWLEAELTCPVCGTQWKYFCEEWRMLGYHKQLIRADGLTPHPLLIQALYEKIGCDPDKQLDLEKWVLFMQQQ